MVSSPSGLMSDVSTNSNITGVFRTLSPSTFAFGIVEATSSFYGVLDALRQDDLLKIVSEPTLVAINGATATFNSGGEIPVPEPQSLGTISIAWKQYGTQVKFVPVVLGNGKVRLEVWPLISELDETRSFNFNGTQVPSIKNRDIKTTVELRAGETLALAGLVQTVLEAENGGLPWISEVPYLGAAFRHVKETRNEIELLMLVTPEWVEGMDANQAPVCGPGSSTTSPTDWQLFMRGYVEVPKCPAACPGGPCPAGNAPPDGAIIGPGENVPTPPPTDAAARAARLARQPSAAGPQSRYSPSQPNSAPATSATSPPNRGPGLIGPAGYDEVK
jgi:pilus assembly protein CpaC